MTRDEQRNACLEAMKEAWITAGANNLKAYDAMAAAFDALHGIAFVCPIEATEEMMNAGIMYLDSISLRDSFPLPATFRWVFFLTAISEAGNLTNATEKKP